MDRKLIRLLMNADESTINRLQQLASGGEVEFKALFEGVGPAWLDAMFSSGVLTKVIRRVAKGKKRVSKIYVKANPDVAKAFLQAVEALATLKEATKHAQDVRVDNDSRDSDTLPF